MAEVLGLIVNCLTVVDLAARVVATLCKYGEDVSYAGEDINRILDMVNQLSEVTSSVQELLKHHGNSHGLRTFQLLRDGILGTEKKLQRLMDDLSISTGRTRLRRLGWRALKWPFHSRETEGILSNLRASLDILNFSLQIDQTSVLLDIDRRALLDKLPHAEHAAFDSFIEERNPRCHPQTRTGILSDIDNWISDLHGKAIFWLNGMAGTGKSTISRTVATSLTQNGRLGASFFFKRGENNRGNCSLFFSTIAFQLALKQPSFAQQLKKILDKEPDLVNKSLGEQSSKLLIEPLSTIPLQSREVTTLIIVVDALDECEDDAEIPLLIHLLSNMSWDPLPWRIKTFVTSRPELPIRLGFKGIGNTYQDLVLHDVSTAVIGHDIRVFLHDELAIIRQDYNNSVPEHRRLGPEWPTSTSVDLIAEMAVPLFIFAATVCRFVSDRRSGSPPSQLQRFLDYKTYDPGSKLGAIYLPILGQMVTGLADSEREEILADFRRIVGTIVFLFSPLSAQGLATLLDITQEQVENRLDWLHSCLSVPSDCKAPIRLLHLSFRDFLALSSNIDGNQFQIDAKLAHYAILGHCLTIMEACLEPNICKFEEETYITNVQENYIDTYISESLRYSCLWWVQHAILSGSQLRDGDQVHRFLERHFLNWLEVLCILSFRAGVDIPGQIRNLQAALHPDVSQELNKFLSDAERVIQTNLHMICATPLQVHFSMLAFTPSRSVIRTHFECGIALNPNIQSDWDPCLMTLQDQNGYGRFQSVAFSPDDRHVAALLVEEPYTSHVKIWEVTSRKCCHSFFTRPEKFYTRDFKISFSHNSMFVAAGARNLEVYSVATGQCLLKTTTTGCWGLSSDSPYLAALTDSKKIQIWECGSGPHGPILEREVIDAPDINISWMNLYDGVLTLASEYCNHKVEIWSTSFGVQDKSIPLVMEGPVGFSFTRLITISKPETFFRNKYASVVMSMDSSQLALICPGSFLDHHIDVFDVKSGQLHWSFESDKTWAAPVVFSPNAQWVARDAGYGTVYIASSSSREFKSIIPTPSVLALAFSRDSTRIVVGLSGAVQIWSIKAAIRASARSEIRRQPLSWVQFSPDSSTAAAGAIHGDIQIWNSDNGECLRILQGHPQEVCIYTFSDDSRRFASYCGKYLKIWCVDTGECLESTDMFSVRYREPLNLVNTHLPRFQLINKLPNIDDLSQRTADLRSAISRATCGRMQQIGIYESYNLIFGVVDFCLKTGYFAFAERMDTNWRIKVNRWANDHWIPVTDCPDSATEPVIKLCTSGNCLVVWKQWSLSVFELANGSLLCELNPTPRIICDMLKISPCNQSITSCGCPSYDISLLDLRGRSWSPWYYTMSVCHCQPTSSEPGSSSVMNRETFRTVQISTTAIRDWRLTKRTLVYGEHHTIRLPQTYIIKGATYGGHVANFSGDKVVIVTELERVVFINLAKARLLPFVRNE